MKNIFQRMNIKNIINDPAIVRNESNLDKYIIVKGYFEKKIDCADDFIKNLEKNDKAYQFFLKQQETQIFTQNNNNYIRFITSPDKFDFHSLILPNNSNIEKANDTIYVQRNNISEKFNDYFKSKNHILIRGASKIGKTRFIFEELSKLKNNSESYYIFSFNQLLYKNGGNVEISEKFNAEKRKLIWFIDDLNYEITKNDSIFELSRKLSKNHDVITVAVLSSHLEKETQNKILAKNLIKDMKIIDIPLWEKEKVNKLVEYFAQQDNLEKSSIKMPLADTDYKYDLFIASPMAAYDTNEQYQKDRQNILNISIAFQKKFNFKSIFYAGKAILSMEDFEYEDSSVKDNLTALKQSKYFVLIYPEALLSSVLVEAGWALALDKPSVYFVRDRNHLPFLLKEAGQAFGSVKIYTYTNVEDLIKSIDNNKREALFEN